MQLSDLSSRKKFSLILATLLCTFFACTDNQHAGVEAGNATIAGIVRDSLGAPVQGAVVTLSGASAGGLKRILFASVNVLQTDTTDTKGAYEFIGLALGDYSIAVKFPRGQTLDLSAQVTSSNEVVTLNFAEPILSMSSSTQSSSSTATGISSSMLVQSSSANTSTTVVSSSIAAFNRTTCIAQGNCGTIVDARDQQSYPWSKIGSQVWLSTNLNYSGDNGAGAKAYKVGWCPGSAFTDTSVHTDSSTCTKYGRLYTWQHALVQADSCATRYCAAIVGSKAQGLCPVGFHVPSKAEFSTLDSFVIADQAADLKGTMTAGQYLKGTDSAFLSASTGWNSTYYFRYNAYGFDALPAGSNVDAVGQSFNVWSSTDIDETSNPGTATGAYLRTINGTDFAEASAAKGYAYSVRCLQN